MLTLTENASTVVKTITDQTTQGDDAGLRISQDGEEAAALAVTPSDTPQPGDQVLEDEGARVFLDGSAAETLEDKVLDAAIDEGGAVQFSIAPQATDID